MNQENVIWLFPHGKIILAIFTEWHIFQTYYVNPSMIFYKELNTEANKYKTRVLNPYILSRSIVLERKLKLSFMYKLCLIHFWKHCLLYHISKKTYQIWRSPQNRNEMIKEIIVGFTKGCPWSCQGPARG